MQSAVRISKTESNTYNIISMTRTAQETQQRKKEEQLYMAKQKVIGVIAVAIGIVSCVACQDAMLCVLMFPIGIGAIVTKQHILN